MQHHVTLHTLKSSLYCVTSINHDVEDYFPGLWVWASPMPFLFHTHQSINVTIVSKVGQLLTCI